VGRRQSLAPAAAGPGRLSTAGGAGADRGCGGRVGFARFVRHDGAAHRPGLPPRPAATAGGRVDRGSRLAPRRAAGQPELARHPPGARRAAGPGQRRGRRPRALLRRPEHHGVGCRGRPRAGDRAHRRRPRAGAGPAVRQRGRLPARHRPGPHRLRARAGRRGRRAAAAGGAGPARRGRRAAPGHGPGAARPPPARARPRPAGRRLGHAGPRRSARGGRGRTGRQPPGAQPRHGAGGP
jgi:hypothetical protein